MTKHLKLGTDRADSITCLTAFLYFWTKPSKQCKRIKQNDVACVVIIGKILSKNNAVKREKKNHKTQNSPSNLWHWNSFPINLLKKMNEREIETKTV